MKTLERKDAKFISDWIISKFDGELPRRNIIDVLSILFYKKLTHKELDVMTELSEFRAISIKENTVIKDKLGLTLNNIRQITLRLRRKGLIVGKGIEPMFIFSTLSKDERINILQKEILKKEFEIELLKKGIR
jgi:hypothetical protein